MHRRDRAWHGQKADGMQDHERASRGVLTRRDVLKGLSSAALATAVGTRAMAGPARAHAATPPNVVLVTADDLGQYLGVYGDRLARTPQLDALAADSVRFNRAYVTQASCSPSRSSILTGLYPHQNGQIGLANDATPYQMDSGVRTLPQMLGDAGYRTGILGKLHVEPVSSFPFDVDETNLKGNRDVALFADRARQFISGGSDPFFLMVNYADPHTKFQTQVEGLPANPHPPDSVPSLRFQQIDTPEVREHARGYRNGIARLDAGIGMLLSVLGSAGKLDNTLLIFIGDHGAPMVRGKTSSYEAGVKVPFLVRFPGHQDTGRVRTHKMVSTVDIVPTILDATDTAGPGGLPGRSLLPLLGATPGSQLPWRPTLVTEYFAHHDPDRPYPRRAIRGDRFKYIANLDGGKPNPLIGIDGDMAYRDSRSPQYIDTPQGRAMTRFANPPAKELYDLEEDPYEFRNLAGAAEHRAELERLQSSLDQWQAATADPLRSRTAAVSATAATAE